MSDPTKKTTVYHYQKLQERFREYTPTPDSPLWDDYCTYLAMKTIEDRKEAMLEQLKKQKQQNPEQ